MDADVTLEDEDGKTPVELAEDWAGLQAKGSKEEKLATRIVQLLQHKVDARLLEQRNVCQLRFSSGIYMIRSF